MLKFTASFCYDSRKKGNKFKITTKLIVSFLNAQMSARVPRMPRVGTFVLGNDSSNSKGFMIQVYKFYVQTHKYAKLYFVTVRKTRRHIA